MTLEEVKQAYIDKFGGYPAFLLMGAEETEIIKKLSICLETGEELEPDDEEDVF